MDLATGRELRTLVVEGSGSVQSVALSADGRLAISGFSFSYGGMTIRVWDVETGRELRRMHGYKVNSVALSASGRRAISASETKTFEVWDVEQGVNCIRLLGIVAG